MFLISISLRVEYSSSPVHARLAPDPDAGGHQNSTRRQLPA